MRTSANFKIRWSHWQDPGDYPNALAGNALPSFWYPEISGRCVIELEPHEIEPTREQLEEMAADECPAQVLKWILCWDWEHRERRATLEVEEFDPDSVEREMGTED